MTIDDLTREQENVVDALCLRDGGFAKVDLTVGGMIRVDTGHGRRYDVLSDGSSSPGGPGAWSWTGFADLMADVYGSGAPA